MLTTYAGIAQLAEQLICNQQVVGSIPIASSNCNKTPESGFRSFLVSSQLEMTAQAVGSIPIAGSNCNQGFGIKRSIKQKRGWDKIQS